jgi:hypothetical protein
MRKAMVSQAPHKGSSVPLARARYPARKGKASRLKRQGIPPEKARHPKTNSSSFLVYKADTREVPALFLVVVQLIFEVYIGTRRPQKTRTNVSDPTDRLQNIGVMGPSGT